MAPTEVVERRADARAAALAAQAGDGELVTSRRALQRRRAARRRRLYRLRRTAVLLLSLLFVGTLVARSTQDPAVAMPRASVTSATAKGATPAPVVTPTPTAVASPTATGTAATMSPDDYEGMLDDHDGAVEPTASPGASLAPVQESARGSVHPVAIPAAPWRTDGRAVRLSVEIEDGLVTDEQAFAATVAAVLSDARGWQPADNVHFVPVSPQEVLAGARVDIRVTLATPTYTNKLCGPLQTGTAKVSCWWGGRAVINLHRWIRGATSYGPDMKGYRTYLLNHEVGHGLGHRHVACAGAGKPAPIMLQQTLRLDGCTAWPWPTKP